MTAAAFLWYNIMWKCHVFGSAEKENDVKKPIMEACDLLGREESLLNLPAVADYIADSVVLVTGGGETTVALATRYGEKIGLLGIVEYAPKAYVRMIPDKLVGNIKPDGVNSTLDLMTPEGRKNCLKAAMDLKNMGAEVIALGCTGLATIGIAREIEEVTGIPVIDPVLAQGAFAAFEAAKRM